MCGFTSLKSARNLDEGILPEFPQGGGHQSFPEHWCARSRSCYSGLGFFQRWVAQARDIFLLSLASLLKGFEESTSHRHRGRGKLSWKTHPFLSLAVRLPRQTPSLNVNNPLSFKRESPLLKGFCPLWSFGSLLASNKCSDQLRPTLRIVRKHSPRYTGVHNIACVSFVLNTLARFLCFTNEEIHKGKKPSRKVEQTLQQAAHWRGPTVKYFPSYPPTGTSIKPPWDQLWKILPLLPFLQIFSEKRSRNLLRYWSEAIPISSQCKLLLRPASKRKSKNITTATWKEENSNAWYMQPIQVL